MRKKKSTNVFEGIFVFIMITAAVVCVGFAVYLALGLRPQTTALAYGERRTYLPVLGQGVFEGQGGEVDDYVDDEVVAVFYEVPYIPYFLEEYAELPFFIVENALYYAEFSRERPELSMQTVIWMTNVLLHVPHYAVVVTNYDENPLLVSPQFRLPPGFSPSELVPVNSDTCPLFATPQTVAAFRELRAASRRAGLDLSVTSAYRTAARQAELWIGGGSMDGRVARPYHSEHQTGRALDLWGPGGLLDANGPSAPGIWVRENAHYHGFILRYRADTTHITGFIYEPWHITYVGTEISMYMHENNILSLEEFVGRNPWVVLG